MTARLRLAVLLLLLAPALYAREFAVRPAPAWVERTDADTQMTVAKEHVRWGIYDILADHQVRLHGSETDRYFRTVRMVLSPSGVQNASELSFDFDPSFEHLTIHDVTIIRGKTRTNALDPDDVRVIEKEDDASDRIYDGEMTAMVFLKDVRPGDIIDYSWSVDGANPILNGKYADDYDLSSGVPTRLIRHRLLMAANRMIRFRGAVPAVTVKNGLQSVVWEKRDVKAIDIEDSIPSWFQPWQGVQLSEFTSWNEVARWSVAMFHLDANSQAAVKKLAEKIRAEHKSDDERITAAIRFVQDDIRYLGIEMGRNSHEPHQPADTIDRRWGDCKDKAFLLSAVLRELGLEAYPALVNTRATRRLDVYLPSPFVFDHVITQVLAHGKTYWVDGTISDQGGTLASMETPSYERAIVVRNETDGLAKIETNETGSTAVEQTYTTTDYAQPVTLDVRTTYTGADADSMRSSLASMSIDDFAKDRINELATDQPKIEAIHSPTVHDDRLHNVLWIEERYRVRDLWKEGEWSWYPRTLEQYLDRPSTIVRSMPLAFSYPLNVTQTVTFKLPEDIHVAKSDDVTETETFRHEYWVDSNGNTVWIKQTLKAKKDFVAAADVPDHLTKINDIWDEIGYRLSPTGAKVAAGKKKEDGVAAGDVQGVFASMPTAVKWTWGSAVFVLVFGSIAGAIYAASKRRARTIGGGMFRPGEAPASAWLVRGNDDIDALLATSACACGASIQERAELQRAFYAERELTIATRHCAVCGREQSLYFTA